MASSPSMKKILKAFHDAGHDQAIIAGGAIRDMYFKNKPKDYDVFIYEAPVQMHQFEQPAPPPSPTFNNSPGAKNVKAKQSINVPIAKVEEEPKKPTINFRIEADREEFRKILGAERIVEMTAKPKKVSTSSGFGSNALAALEPAKVEADEMAEMFSDVDENFVVSVFKYQFTSGPAVEVITLTMNPTEYVERYFDLGICKAYFNGSKVHYTPDFMRDVRGKTITLCGEMSPNQLYRSLNKHTGRMLQKFPGYDLRIDRDKVLNLK